MDYTIKQTVAFEDWHKSQSLVVKAAVARRILQASLGLFGDVKYHVGDNVSEMRIHIGAGYRVYFTVKERTIIFLLWGGDKRSQQSDIKRAEQMAKEL